MSNFQNIYNTLNPDQLKAVTSIEGPVMVMAGPGTGKTQVLAARIAFILQETDTQPQQILALTFTESAATTMRRRLVAMIGRAGYYVQIMTFHAFCSGVIQHYPEVFGIDRDSTPLSDLERYELFEELLYDESLQLNLLKPLNKPLLYLKDSIGAISDLKREDVSPELLEKLIIQEEAFLDSHALDLTKKELKDRQKNVTKHKELLILYQSYQERLHLRQRYDFDDMISYVGEVFMKNEDILLDYQESIHYFLIDEYQDTNASQNKVVDVLASHWEEQANIFVVGDPNQAIYRFQGASVENALGFIDRYPQAQTITLSQGYRCPQSIYDAASGIISHNTLNNIVSDQFPDINAPLKSQKKKQEVNQLQKADNEVKIEVATATNQTIELWYVFSHIESLLKSGVPAKEIAVLFRHNRDAFPLQLGLSRRGIMYDIEKGDDVLQNERVRQLFILLEVIDRMRPESQLAGGQDPHQLFEVLSYDWVPVKNVHVYELTRQANQQKISLLLCIERIAKEIEEKTADGSELNGDLSYKYQDVVDFVSLLRSLGQADYNTVFPEWFVRVLDQSGYKNWILNQSEKVEHLINIQSVYAQVKELSASQKNFKLSSFLRAITVMQNHGLTLSAEDFSIGDDGVCLSTVHRAKGREWRYVFVVHCLDKKWGNTTKKEKLPLPEGVLKKTDLDKKELNEDDRRLFYVALTRASEKITITYSTSKVNGTRTVEVIPSMFIEELYSAMPAEMILRKSIEPPEEAVVHELESALSPIPTSIFRSENSVIEKSFFAHLVENFTLSVTALNTYLRDPDAFVLNTLLRVPRAKESHLSFGTAIHAALEYGFTFVSDSKPVDITAIQEKFERSLRKEMLTEMDFDRWLAKGREIVRVYFEQPSILQATPFQLERGFGFGQAQTYLDDISLSGRIDRVDWLDTEKATVKVIDYKTGSAKSENHILGLVPSMDLSDREKSLPEPIRGPLKRQLLFYKLLTELDTSFKPNVTHGSFEFVEPNKSGKLVTRQFELHQEDVELLKNLIREVMAEMRQLQFLD